MRNTTCRKRRIFLIFIIVLCLAVIFLFSSQSADGSKKLSEGISVKIARLLNRDHTEDTEDVNAVTIARYNRIIRKAAHTAEYAVLGMLLYIFVSTFSLKRITGSGISLGGCLLYAVLDELHQVFIPGRGPRATDVLIDSLGAIAGIAAAAAVLYLVSATRARRG